VSVLSNPYSLYTKKLYLLKDSNMSSDEGFALDEIHSRRSTDEVTEIEQPTLAPTDGGSAAWLMLASCCLIQLPVWGL
jgi:hypothetical protein